MKGSFISKSSGDTTGAARCPGPTNPGAGGGTFTTRLIPRRCDMFSPSEINFPVHLYLFAERALCAIRVVPYRRRSRSSHKETPCLPYCDAIHPCVAGFALKMLLKP